MLTTGVQTLNEKKLRARLEAWKQCHVCGKEEAKACGGCLIFFFCGRSCQSVAWNVHKYFCNSGKKDLSKESEGLKDYKFKQSRLLSVLERLLSPDASSPKVRILAAKQIGNMLIEALYVYLHLPMKRRASSSELQSFLDFMSFPDIWLQKRRLKEEAEAAAAAATQTTPGKSMQVQDIMSSLLGRLSAEEKVGVNSNLHPQRAQEAEVRLNTVLQNPPWTYYAKLPLSASFFEDLRDRKEVEQVVDFGCGRAYWSMVCCAYFNALGRSCDFTLVDVHAKEVTGAFGLAPRIPLSLSESKQQNKFEYTASGVEAFKLLKGQEEKTALWQLWPTNQSEVSAAALNCFPARFVVACGEPPGGCTGCDSFFMILEKNYTQGKEYMQCNAWKKFSTCHWYTKSGGQYISIPEGSQLPGERKDLINARDAIAQIAIAMKVRTEESDIQRAKRKMRLLEAQAQAQAQAKDKDKDKKAASKVNPKEQRTEEFTKEELQGTHIMRIPIPDSPAAQELRDVIPESDWFSPSLNLERAPFVTVCLKIASSNITGRNLEILRKEFGPFPLSFGHLEVLESKDLETGKMQDILCLRAGRGSAVLRVLHERACQVFETYHAGPAYCPHIRLAFLKHGAGAKYLKAAKASKLKVEVRVQVNEFVIHELKSHAVVTPIVCAFEGVPREDKGKASGEDRQPNPKAKFKPKAKGKPKTKTKTKTKPKPEVE